MSTENKPIKAGVIGWPVEHSLSPRLHGYWLKEYGIDGTYDAIPVDPENVEGFIRRLADNGFAGINVTVPHKEAAFAAVDETDVITKCIGAVNTIFVGADGKLTGRNTDGFGFMQNLREGAPKWGSGDGPVVVLGAGGAARSIIVSLLYDGVSSIRLTNRTQERGENLAIDIPADTGGDTKATIDIIPWEKRSSALDGAALLVNTTTLGMTGKDPLDLDLGNLPSSCVITDIVYAPLVTPLLAAAAARGNVTVDGIGMLLHQARPGFSAWFGVEPTVTDAQRAFVLEGLGA